MRFWVVLVTGLLLAGCYESGKLLLDSSQARQPIASAQDWTYGGGDHRYHARLTPRSDGWYDYAEASIGANGRDGGWKHYRVLLNDLTKTENYDVFVYGTFNTDDNAYMYGIVAVGAGGFWQTVTPTCDPAGANPTWTKQDIAAATAAGGALRSLDTMAQVCQFSSRAALLRAMKTIVATPGFDARLKAAAK